MNRCLIEILVFYDYSYVFRILDKNHNKTITFREFLVCISSNTQGTLKERLELVFDMLVQHISHQPFTSKFTAFSYHASRSGGKNDTTMNRQELTDLIVMMVQIFSWCIVYFTQSMSSP